MPGLPFIQSAFAGGLNTRDSATLLDQRQLGESRDLQNVQGLPAGAIVKRLGLATLCTPPATLTSLASFEAVSPSVMVAAGGTSLYSITGSGTVTAIKTGLTSNVRWEFTQAPTVLTQGPLYAVNGTDAPQQWNGVAASTSNWVKKAGTGVDPPNGKFICYYRNQVFIAGTAANPSRVYWSALADPADWDPASLTGAGFADFDPNDGQPITSIGIVGPYVLVAKARKLWVIVDPATASIRPLSNNVGVAAHRSVCSAAEGTYFLAEDHGVYLTNGAKIQPLSDNIRPTFDSIQPGLRSQAAAVYFNAHYYLSVPINGAPNDTILDWDVTLQSWWLHTFGSNQMTIFHVSGSPTLYSAKATGNFVDQAFAPGVFTDNGVPFLWRWASAWHSPSYYRRRWFPTPEFRKRLKQVRLSGTGTVDFSVATNFSSSAAILRQSDVFNAAAYAPGKFAGAGQFAGSGVFADKLGVSRAKFNSFGTANAFSLVFSAASTTGDSLISYMMSLSDRKDSLP